MEKEYKLCDIDGCEKKAVINIQGGFGRYPIDEHRKYGKPVFEADIGGGNEFRCGEHEYD
jgi:hypothetical protein